MFDDLDARTTHLVAELNAGLNMLMHPLTENLTGSIAKQIQENQPEARRLLDKETHIIDQVRGFHLSRIKRGKPSLAHKRHSHMSHHRSESKASADSTASDHSQ